MNMLFICVSNLILAQRLSFLNEEILRKKTLCISMIQVIIYFAFNNGLVPIEIVMYKGKI